MEGARYLMGGRIHHVPHIGERIGEGRYVGDFGLVSNWHLANELLEYGDT